MIDYVPYGLAPPHGDLGDDETTTRSSLPALADATKSPISDRAGCVTMRLAHLSEVRQLPTSALCSQAENQMWIVGALDRHFSSCVAVERLINPPNSLWRFALDAIPWPREGFKRA